MQFEIHVRPSSAKASVGGEHDGALVVHVVEPADRGRATAAALRSVADALMVPRRRVSLVRGTTTRRKLIAVNVDREADTPVGKKFAALLKGREA